MKVAGLRISIAGKKALLRIGSVVQNLSITTVNDPDSFLSETEPKLKNALSEVVKLGTLSQLDADLIYKDKVAELAKASIIVYIQQGQLNKS